MGPFVRSVGLAQGWKQISALLVVAGASLVGGYLISTSELWVALAPVIGLSVVIVASRLGPYRLALAFLAVSHFLVWVVKVTAGVFPTNYTALVPTLLVSAVYIVTALDWGRRKLRFQAPDSLDILVLAYVLLCLFQVFNDYTTIEVGLRAFQRAAFYSGLYYAARLAVTTPNRAHSVVTIIALTGAAAGGFAFLKDIVGLPLDGGYDAVVRERSGEQYVALAQKRSNGTLGSQASFGFMLALAGLCSVTWVLHGRVRWRIVAVAALVLNVLGLLLSGSRASMLAFGLGGALLAFQAADIGEARKANRALRNGWPASIISITICALCVLTVITFFPNLVADALILEVAQDRLASISPVAWITGEAWGDPNWRARADAWKSIAAAIADRPLTGYGLGVLGGGTSDARVGVRDVGGYTVADNQYVQLWAETGLFGLLVYLGVLFVGLGRSIGRGTSPAQRSLLALTAGSVASLAVVGLAAPPLEMYPANAFSWVILGAGSNLARDSKGPIGVQRTNEGLSR